MPGWTYLLIVFGVLPFLSPRSLGDTTVSASVPVAPELHGSLLRLRRVRAPLLVAGLVLALAGIGTWLGLSVVGIGLLATAAVAALVGAAHWVGALPGRTREIPLWRVRVRRQTSCTVHGVSALVRPCADVQSNPRRALSSEFGSACRRQQEEDSGPSGVQDG